CQASQPTAPPAPARWRNRRRWPLLRSLPEVAARDRGSTVSCMRVMASLRRSFARSAAVAAIVSVTIGVGQVVGVFASTSSGAASSVPLGTASATAQTYKVNPQTGALSLGIAFGETLTNYQNKVAIAEAR